MLWPLVAIAALGWLAVPVAVALVLRSRARRERRLVTVLRHGVAPVLTRMAQDHGIRAESIPATETDVGIAIAHLDAVAQRIARDEKGSQSIATSDTIPIDVIK
jgi:hypothetical protein